jgi:photosystem II stability/assembly factor-like uncharacterized protein
LRRPGQRSAIAAFTISFLLLLFVFAPLDGHGVSRIAAHPADWTGIFRSDDGGHTWQYVETSPPVNAILDLVVDPTRPHILYAATDLLVWRSGDGGEVWKLLSKGFDGHIALALALDPNDSTRLYAVTDRGLHVSSDEGQTWQRLESPGARPLTVATSSRHGLLAGTSEGVVRSTDGGQQWRSSVGLPPVPVFALTVAVDGRVHAATAAGPFWSDDGQTWHAPRRAPGVGRVFAVTTSGDDLYVVGDERVYRSVDQGQTWEPMGASLHQPAPVGEVRPFGVAPRGDAPTGLLGLTRRGLLASADRGATWQHVPPFDNLSYLEIKAFAMAPGAPGVAYLGASVVPYDGMLQRMGIDLNVGRQSNQLADLALAGALLVVFFGGGAIAVVRLARRASAQSTRRV